MSTEAPKELAVVIMGSAADKAHADKITGVFTKLGLPYEVRVGSAHKTPEHVLEMVRAYDSRWSDTRIAYVTVAGRSDALTAFVASSTVNPVIGAPPYSEKYSGLDFLSSLRVPSGVGAAVAIEPEAAALETVKILALTNQELRASLANYLEEAKDKVIKSDDLV